MMGFQQQGFMACVMFTTFQYYNICTLCGWCGCSLPNRIVADDVLHFDNPHNKQY